MPQLQRSAIVPYSAEAMFRLIADLESYPEFLPGCAGSGVLSREEGVILASLSIARGPFAATFTTRNTLVWPTRMSMELVDGPFSSLHGEWQVVPLGPGGSRIQLAVHFEFSSPARDLFLAGTLASTCTSLVEAFVERAKAVYG